MYIDPRVSPHDIATQLAAQGVRSYYGNPFSRSTISLILRNPIYAMADLDIYEFFKSQETEIYNDAADFVGTNGCYYYRSKGSTDNKHKYLQGQMLVLAPSEGFIPSELWLRVRKKIMANQSCQPARKARHSCGYLYFRYFLHADNKSCPGCGTIKMRELEAVVYQQMVKKLEDYKTLTGAPPVLISYVNAKIEKLDSRRQALASEIAKLTAEAVSTEQIDTISNYLDDWENVSSEDKQQVVDLMITVIRATCEKLQIEWKI